MLNRTPPNKPINTTNVINSYRKRRMQRGPILIYGAVGLVVIGIILLVVWLMQPDQLIGAMLATDTPTPTSTSTPTNTPVPTQTATITSTPTVTLTATPSEPFSYIVQENDSLFSIADQNNLGNNGILFLLLLNPEIDQCNPNLQVGDTIQVPNPGAQIPTSTPVPPELSRGTKVTYLVQSGDTLAGVAAIFNSTTDEILKANELTDPNAINVGQCLTIPVNLVTATATLPSTSTPVTPTIEGQPTQAPAAATSTPGTGGSTACTGTGNAGFVTELQTLINDERAKNSLPALTVNQKLVSSANAYATNMLCNNYFSPVGLDGSTAKSRATVQGYSASVIVENLYALHPVYGITPQLAFNWWMKNPEYSANILNPNVTEMGVTYVSDENTLFGAYFVATFAKP